MRTLLQQTGDAELKLRSRAMECVGHMIEAVGREQCEDAVRESTAFALSGLQLGLPELREYTFGFFAQLGDVIGDELAPLLPALLPACVAALESDETLEWRGGAKDDTLAATLAKLHGDGEGDDDDDDDDDDDEDGRRGGTLSVRTALLDEKAAAAHCVGACATATAGLFHPHLERCATAVLACADYFHEDVRGASCRAIAQLVGACAAAEIAPIDQGAWVRGGAVDASLLPPLCRALCDRAMAALCDRLLTDEDKDVVAAAAEAVAGIGKVLGPPALSPYAERIAAAVAQLLTQEHTCQEQERDEEAAPGLLLDEDEDHDTPIWEALTEIMIGMSRTLGARWQIHFDKLLPHLTRYLNPSHPTGSTQAMAMAILAETVHQLEGAAAIYVQQLLPLALRCSASEDATCRQNSTFGLGVFGQWGGAIAIAQMQPILSAIQARLDPTKEDEGSVRDNAYGALSRLVLAHGAALPLPSILPALLAALPLEEDPGENAPALRALMKCTHGEGTRPLMAPHVPALLVAIARCVGTDALEASVLDEARQFVAWLHSQGAAQLEGIVMAMKEEERAALASLRDANPTGRGFA